MADPLSSEMSGRATVEKTRTGTATTLAVGNGAEMPRNCGTNSPKTIENNVTSTSATPVDTDSTVTADAPGRIVPSGTESSRPIDG